MHALFLLKTYDPNSLIDWANKFLLLDNDLSLAHRLRMPPPVISKIRHLILPVGPTLLLCLHEETGLSVRELRALMGDHRTSYSVK